MSDVVIRQTKEEDYTAFHRLNRDELGYEFDLEKTAARLAQILRQPENRLFTAELDGEIVGYVHASNYGCCYSSPQKNILAIAVNSSLQGQGIGRKLLAAVEAWAKADGCAAVRLVSSQFRGEAHNFYLACGYEVRKEQKNFIKYL